MPPSFWDLQPDRIMSVQDYLASIHSPIKRDMTAGLLSVAPAVFEQIRAESRSTTQMPLIRIANHPEPSAQCMEGMIELSAGLIEYCLGIEYPNTKAAIGIDTSFNAVLVPTAVFSWFFSHECYHIVRQHNKLLEYVETDVDTLKAIERDADLCAVGTLYRTFQSLMVGIVQDNDIRRLVLYCVYWALRRLTDRPQMTHSRPDERVIHAFGKISMLTISPFAPRPDVDAKLPETQARAHLLAQDLITLEKLFRRTFPNVTDDFDISARAKEGADRQTVIRWDELQLKHSIVTAQR